MPASTALETPQQKRRNGFASALGAYLFWGIFPVYFKVVQAVPSTEVLAHRIVWALPFGAFIIGLRGQWPEVRSILLNRRVLGLLALSSGLIAVNWLVYIVAVQSNNVFEASLGYYINPLINVVVGVLLFSERLYKLQIWAVMLAAVGVAVLAAGSTSFPWISLTLAATFTCYGVIRKAVAVGGMPGLFVETLFLAPAGLLYLTWLTVDGTAMFATAGLGLNVLLVLAGPFTVVPLLLFALAARRLDLSTIGMLQFIAPTLQFGVGVIYGEILTPAHAFCFLCIWIAISLFVWDAWRRRERVLATSRPG